MSVRYDPTQHTAAAIQAREALPLTRRYITGVAIMSVGTVMLGLAALALIASLITPPPFRYEGSPWPVGIPTVWPGDVVPLTVTRCGEERWDDDGKLAALVTRNMVETTTGLRYVLPAVAVELPADGCLTETVPVNAGTSSTPPGRYRFEFGATVYGRWRTATSFGYSEPFQIVAREGGG